MEIRSGQTSRGLLHRKGNLYKEHQAKERSAMEHEIAQNKERDGRRFLGGGGVQSHWCHVRMDSSKKKPVRKKEGSKKRVGVGI